MLSHDQLNILACPVCKGALSMDHASQKLHCQSCGVSFPIRDGIPVLLIHEATVNDQD